MSDKRREARFEHLRKQAKAWLRNVRSGDEAALRRLSDPLPRHSDTPSLREVQQAALAREQGFASWADLKEHLAIDMAVQRQGERLLDVFLQHACISALRVLWAAPSCARV